MNKTSHATNDLTRARYNTRVQRLERRFSYSEQLDYNRAVLSARTESQRTQDAIVHLDVFRSIRGDRA
jgi:hypothetical protein